MSYDNTKPLDTGYLADAPAELRANFKGIIEDKIVNAAKLNDLEAGNSSGSIPISNGTLNVNLNADMLDGFNASDFAAASHEHDGATSSAAGFMTAAQVQKLEGIATGAEVNQNAFSKVTVGDATVSADSKSDTLTFQAGAGIELTADPENDKLTVKLGSHTHSYLPLSGGTMTGTIIFNKAGQVMKSPGDNGVLRFDGGSDYNKGAFLSLHGMDYNSENAGAFQLSCRSSTFSRDLIGRPDGTLKWGGSNVLTESSGTAVSAKKLNTFGTGISNISGDTTANWGKLGAVATAWLSAGVNYVNNKPSTYLSVLSVASTDTEVWQLAHGQADSDLYYRGGNANGWGGNGTTAWKTILSSSNFTSHVTPAAIGALSTSGNAASATKLATARNITVKYGRNQGTASFNGTSAITISIYCSSDYSDDGAA